MGRVVRVTHVALVGVLLVAPVWLLVRIVSILIGSADRSSSPVDSLPDSTLVIIYVPVLVATLFLLGWQLRLAFGPRSGRRLALLAVTDIVWILVASMGLALASRYGSAGDPARVAAWAILGMAALAALACSATTQRHERPA